MYYLRRSRRRQPAGRRVREWPTASGRRPAEDRRVGAQWRPTVRHLPPTTCFPRMRFQDTFKVGTTIHVLTIIHLYICYMYNQSLLPTNSTVITACNTIINDGYCFKQYKEHQEQTILDKIFTFIPSSKLS